MNSRQDGDRYTTRECIARLTDVSRETQSGMSVLAALETYAQLLVKWQTKINLVSRKSLDTLWTRHILDSAQLIPFLPDSPVKIMDIGSGAGLPGIILAILTRHDIHLVEADQRKCAFLRTAVRETGATAIIHNERIETLADMNPDIITARALAPLDKLLELTSQQHNENLQFLFLKGKTAKQELTSLTSWPKLSAVLHPSITDTEAALIQLISSPVPTE